MMAASKGYKEVVRVLLEGGANVDIHRRDNMETASSLATKHKHYDVVELINKYK